MYNDVKFWLDKLQKILLLVDKYDKKIHSKNDPRAKLISEIKDIVFEDIEWREEKERRI